MSHDYQASLRDTLTRIPLSAPPSPWVPSGAHAVGGLTEIGFAPDADLLLAISGQGRGLFDCVSGTRIERDYDEDWNGLDQTRLVSPGIGALRDTRIRLAGLHGGGLSMTTSDGWGLHCIPLPWPSHSIFMSPPWKSHQFDQWVKIACDGACEFRACGFSDTGQSFAVATSCELLLFARSEA